MLPRDAPAPRPTPSSFSRFRVEHQIGVGALGPVFQGREVSPDRLVAIKAFTLELTGDQAAALADRLGSLLSLDFTHPSIVAPIDAGLESEIPYLVGEYVFGESLDMALRRYGPAPAADAARLLTQVAAALDAASIVGVLHGSLHPRDVLVTPDLVRLTGLGVVASLEGAGARAPARPPYSAPERSAGRSWDARADVFSLASVAVELLTGRPVAEQGRGPALDFGGVLVARPEELTEVLLRGLAPQPRDRYATAGELATALELALTGRSSRPAHAERIPRAAAAARPAGGLRRRRAKPRHEAERPSESELQLASAEPPQSAPAGIADEALAATEMAAGPSAEENRQLDGPLRPADSGASPVDAELRPADTRPGGPGEGEVPPVDIAPQPVDAPELEDAFRLTAPGPERPVAERDVFRLAPVEAPPIATAPVVSVDDLPLEPRPRPGADEPVVERPGSLPFEEREPLPLAAEPGTAPSDGGADDAEAGKPDRRSFPLPIAIAVVAVLVLGLYGAYQIVTRGTTPPESATISVPPANAARAPAPADIYLPAQRPPPAAAPSGPSVRQAPAAKKTTRTATTPKTASSRTSTAKRPAAKTVPGSLSVESRPTGARVFLDGRLSGTTPLVLSKLTAGSHDVRVERTGYRRWSSRIQITSGRRSRLTASLEPESSR